MKKLILRIIVLLLFYDLDVIANDNTIAVLEVELGEEVPEIFSGLITDIVYDTVYQYSREHYTVVARNLRDSMLAEIEFSISDLSDNFNSALKIGEYLSAQYLILTRVNRLGTAYNIMIQMVNVTTTEIEGSYLSEAEDIESIKAAIELCVRNIIPISPYKELVDDIINLPEKIEINTGEILIKTLPSGSNIYIDRISYGVSPLIIENMEPGSINIEIKYEGYENLSVQATVQKGETVNLDLVLNPRPETLIELIYMQGGTFNMGSIDGDYEEEPVHNVKINNIFIGKYEVTYSQYMEFVADTGMEYYARNKWRDDNKPVINITWYDALEFCNWLSLKELYSPYYTIRDGSVYINPESNGYRLPTEAEWEYAASGGQMDNGTEYSGSNNPDTVSWYRDNSGRETHLIGGKVQNRLGLFDMSGNVWEWCWDWYDEDYYLNSTEISPIGPTMGYYKIVRGGSWDSDDFYLRCTARGFAAPDNYDTDIGFRVVRNAEK